MILRLVMLVETDFPTNTMLKWEAWFHTTCFDQAKRYTDENFTKRY